MYKNKKMPQYCQGKDCKGSKNGEEKRAHYNYKGEKPAYCGECKEKDMIDVGNYKCVYVDEVTNERCNHQPTFNFQNEEGNAKALYCETHMDPQMVDIRAIICTKCKIERAWYNKPGLKVPLYCNGCKDKGMCNVRDHACFECGEGARYRSDDKTKWACSIHKTDDFYYPGMRYCEGDGCFEKKKAATFGPIGGKPTYCATHKYLGIDFINLTHPRCKKSGCYETAYYNFSDKKGGVYCGIHADTGMIMLYRKKCIVCNNKYPSFNYRGEKTPLYCSDDKDDAMINILKPDCHEPGCKFIPSYNYPGLIRPESCEKHKSTGMVVLRTPCKEPGCGRRPSYNLPGEKTPIYCSLHPTDKKMRGKMVNIRQLVCLGGCGRSPSYNFAGGKSRYCASCKDPDMIEVIHPRCPHKDCNGKRIASFNFKGQTKPKFCSIHADKGMINITVKRCADPRCSEGKVATTALYGYPGLQAQYCDRHKHAGMIIHPRTRCIHPDCDGEEFAVYGINASRTEYCEEHAPKNYICVINQPCKGCKFIDIIDEQGYCETCHPDKFNNYRLSKQRQVVAWLNATGHNDYRSIDECPPELMECKDGKKNGYKPDILYDMGTHYVIVEIDERQHNTEEYRLCDIPRMVNIQQSLALPTIFIRYNPDPYTVKGETVIITKDKRLNTLVNWLKNAKEVAQIKEPLQVVYLFYDEYSEVNTQYQPMNILSIAMSFAFPSSSATSSADTKGPAAPAKKKPVRKTKRSWIQTHADDMTD